ncbi:DUF4328 domain-containing protein [Mycobacterium sp. PS03-16]|uniref:DUF4328 domain-containing protein n=1 Tax=Mycobacterium sp. PS03-16 TaxID=2559611 RepID=UPI001073697C|nr:DUF4328 domain-containing protein [Mycobacterium sp. PS03-16]TFV54258.1 DUF4328 domain-containing protein [Mycobacterium sp. PS03-16]
MIQVCSRCGTRWNVRDRERQWCPRCQGALMAPSGHATAAPEWSARAAGPGPGGAPPRLPAGYRWIAVRPGAPPPPRARRRPLGPTPRYASVPRWGLVEHFDTEDTTPAADRHGPSATTVRRTLITTLAVLGVTAFVHVIRYVLLLVNRSMLLHPIVAGAATWLGVAMSVIALFCVIASLVVLTNWLVARRAAAYRHHGQADPRDVWALRLGCLVPFVNLIFAPVYAFELADVENRLSTLRRPIVVWWILWVFSTVVSLFSIATSFTTDAQGIADNTVLTTVAYLLALATLLVAYRVVLGFERAPVARAVTRWVMVPDDGRHAGRPAAADPGPDRGTGSGARDADGESRRPVESSGQNPAA